jgi:hypothetical protein
MNIIGTLSFLEIIKPLIVPLYVTNVKKTGIIWKVEHV